MMQMQKAQTPLGFGDALKNKLSAGHSLMQRTICLLRLEIWLTVAAPLASWRDLISRQLQHALTLSRVMVPGLHLFF